jgi:adenylate kinase family enzyme
MESAKTKGFNFPVFKTKLDNNNQKFALEDPVERRKYFDLKAREEIEKLREYLQNNTFVGFLLGKKNSGKGTYSKLFMEAVGTERIAHISVGDIVRRAHEDLEDEKKRGELKKFLDRRYRGFVQIDEVLESFLGRDTKSLMSTELILALVEQEIDKIGRKAIFIDGFPRSIDQISYSLYLRSLIGYRDDPDFLVFIDLPESIIDERMKYRVICPNCQTPRSTKLLRTNEVEYNETTKQFYLICDNPGCQGRHRMVQKEGDELGIEAIRDRIEVDDEIMRSLLNLQGIPKVYLRNAVPVKVAKDNVENYEITPAYKYEWRKDSKKVEVIEEPWVVNDEDGDPSYSLLPAPVALSMIKQIAKVLNL